MSPYRRAQSDDKIIACGVRASDSINEKILYTQPAEEASDEMSTSSLQLR